MNREGERPNQYPLLENLPQRQISARRTGPIPLHEYSITTPDQPSFDYNRPKRETAPIPPHDRAMRLEPDNRFNDVGFMRGITGPDKSIQGVIYHPVGERRGFARAELEPLDRQGREQNRILHDRAQHTPRSPTWPTRSAK